ncbi:zinc finger, CCHC-type, Retrotransposon gag domain protein [Artemisia annua]|uniref:Zinc finger, CCHC-type, Retrotransposon gag domain protein n=1 Tax=Artemisia annua TaxID=35608 RepID=A0A2U1KUS3_ARTAN|nr:zinc finger, CCHC-type, Retrotransposon gag domain protein [Artemisia annua]
MYLTIKKKKTKTQLHLLGAKIPKAQKRKNPQGATIFTGFMHVVSLDLKKIPKARASWDLARLFEEFRQEASNSGGGGTLVTISGWLKKFGKQKPRSFSSTNTPVDAENWITYIEKIFEVLDYGDEFMDRLASYKLEGDALNWWKAYKQAKCDAFVITMTSADFRDVFFTQYFPVAEQQKFEWEYHTIRQGDNETPNEFMKQFLRLAGFLRTKAGTQEEQASHFKWGLKEWILDGIVNTEFTDVAQGY